MGEDTDAEDDPFARDVEADLEEDEAQVNNLNSSWPLLCMGEDTDAKDDPFARDVEADLEEDEAQVNNLNSSWPLLCVLIALTVW